MATQVDKIDLSLDDIIKQNRKAKAKRGMPVNRLRGAMRGKKRGTGVSPLNRLQQQAAQLKKTAIRGGRGRGRGVTSRGRGAAFRGQLAAVSTRGGLRGRGRGTARGTARGTGQTPGLARARVEVAINRVQLAKEKLEEAKLRLNFEQKKQREAQFMTNRQIQPQSTRGVRGRGSRGRGRAGRLVRPSVDHYKNQNLTKKNFKRQNQSQLLSVRFSNIQQPQARRGGTSSSFRGTRGSRGRGRSSGAGRKVFF
ncbi:hypothetical protein CAPTEDRAFT_221422 [Capitella teleta]|uniref:Forty-two-three domain-containing protein 1 n=1 Tax=Capitella teleta TaxID=283909 RepID=R7V2Z0_CAPTE|nr:hypothetical protein CAPTEDRAFT_221422 [Capitella teleta]|eukprot:ELU10046.1 hypothetical protein CAPTEDRAFT_221422 [Capitella teleta]